MTNEQRLIPRRKPLTARVGLFGVGHHTYWGQFEGLLEEMHGKLARLEEKLRACGVEVVNFGMADSAKSAYALRDRMKAAGLDLVFCDMVTYATSATFAILMRDLDVPMVLSGTFGGVGGFLSGLAIGRIVEAASFAPVFVACGLLYPVGLGIVAVTVRRVNDDSWRC